MLQRNEIFSLAIAFVMVVSLALVGRAGRTTNHPSSAPSHPITSPSPTHPLAAPSSTPSAPRQTLPVSKPAPRESSFSLYNNPAYGISFRYPRNFALQEGDSTEGNFLTRNQDEMSAAQPGSILLATVLMPEDSYPNTTFVGASLQLAVNPSLTPETCKEFLILRAPGPSATLRATTIQGEPFHWTEETTATDSTQFYERDYAGFSNGTCYELYLRVAVASAANYDGWKKQADGEKILRHLEKIVSTLQIHPKPAASARQEVPLIQAFTVTPLPDPVLQNIYRISWNVSGARENQVFVSVDCLDGVGTYQLPNGLTDLDSPKSSFPCGLFAPVASNAGFIDLQFDNYATEGFPERFTLFVAGLNFATRTTAIQPRDPSPLSSPQPSGK